MNTTRATRAGLAFAFVLALAAAGCASGTSSPGAAPSPSPTAVTPVPGTTSPPSTTATPTTTPKPTTTPAPKPTTKPKPKPAPTSTVVLSRVSYPWAWPNANAPTWVNHSYAVPPVPELVRIGVGNHPAAAGERAYNRMTFTFTTAFPSYWFEYTDTLVADPSGKAIPLKGMGVLRIAFRTAQAHTTDGRSSVTSQPGRNLGLSRIVDYARAGDFEGIVVYGIGVTWPIAHSNPQIPVRAYEVETVSVTGQHLYTVAVDVDATNPGT